jgi:SSS family solute:Na+ symporter
MWAMLLGGGTTITLILINTKLPLGLDPNIFGITASALTFVLLTFLFPNKEYLENVGAAKG